MSIPFRVPLSLVAGRPVKCPPLAKDDKGEATVVTEAMIDDVMEKVKTSVREIYDEKRPDWEERPLVIS